MIPLPADASRCRGALRSLRGAALLSAAEAVRASRAGRGEARRPGGRAALEQRLRLIELNPVVVHRSRGCMAVDALVRA